jgi:hypothetical protein
MLTTEEKAKVKDKVIAEFNDRLSKSEYGYVVSWHLSDPPRLKTPKVNQILMGEVKAGKLHYVSYRFATFFYPADTLPRLAWSLKDILNTSDPRLLHQTNQLI